jgi:hypothetical protein
MSFWQSILLMNSVKTDAILGRWWPYLNMKTILFSQVWRAVHSRQYLSCQVYEKIIATLLINQLVGSNDFTKKRELHQKQLTFMSIPVKRASHNSKQPKNNSVNIILITHALFSPCIQWETKSLLCKI